MNRAFSIFFIIIVFISVLIIMLFFDMPVANQEKLKAKTEMPDVKIQHLSPPVSHGLNLIKVNDTLSVLVYSCSDSCTILRIK